MIGYPHLHNHTEVSLLDGMRQIEQSVLLAARRNVPVLACTDHGTVAGAIQFHAACEHEGIKPVIGVEAYWVPDVSVKERSQAHITLLARNRTGFTNLIRLISKANVDGFYYKPRVDWSMLEEHSDGIVALTGCRGGILPRAIEAGAGNAVMERLLSIYGRDNLRGEVMYLDAMPKEINHQVRVISDRYGVTVVATNDSHYPLPEDADVHPMLVAMSTKQLLGAPGAFTIDSRELYLKSFDEMLGHGMRDCGNRTVVDREMAATVALAEEFERYSVKSAAEYPTPKQWVGEDPETLLRQLCDTGLRWRDVNDAAHRKQLEYELGVIMPKKFTKYFIVLADLYRWLRGEGVVCGPGRGSAAASLVCYALGVTDLDPLDYPTMTFDRFLNPERVDEPDVDCDIASAARPRVIEHLKEAYGEQCVANLGTFSTYSPKALLNDMARALGVTDLRINSEVDSPVWINYLYDLASARAEGREPTILYEDLRMFLAEITEKLGALEQRTGFPVRRAYETFSGQARHLGTHASALILSAQPISEVAPLIRLSDHLVVGFTEGVYRKVLSKTGLLKLDVLGVAALDIIGDTVRLAGLPPIDFSKEKYTDKKVYEQFRKGDTTGIFQYGSSIGITQYTTQVAPDRFMDLGTILALWRPGPLDSHMADEYVKLKHTGQRKLHPVIDTVLETSLGMIIFQEDLIRLYATVAGCTGGQADLFRRDVIKRVVDVDHQKRIEQEKLLWTLGGQKQGIPAPLLQQLWEEMMAFARYGFNVPHALSYGAIGYVMMKLRTYHPAQFIAASLRGACDKDIAQLFMTEAQRLGVYVHPPHVNYSGVSPTVHDGQVWLHFSATKQVGDKAALEVGQKAPYTDFNDFLRRVERRVVNKRVIKNLMLVDAFSGLDGVAEQYAAFEVDPADVNNRKVVLDLLDIVVDSTIPDGAAQVIREKTRWSTDTRRRPSSENANTPWRDDRKIGRA